MRASVELRRAPADDSCSVIVTFEGPRLFGRGWTSWHPTEAEGRRQFRAVRAAALETPKCGDPQRSQHARAHVRWMRP